MTGLSEMTDADLRLAILEKLGYCTHFGGTEIYYRNKQEAKENIWRCRGCEGIIVKQSELPNYSGDIAAAMDLADGFPEWLLSKGSAGYTAHMYLKAHHPYILGKDHFFASSPNKARAISEAAYAALKAEGE